MSVVAKNLPWSSNLMAPFLSETAVNKHWGQFYLGYINKMNTFIEQDPNLALLTLEDIIKNYLGPVKNVAAQILNHEFFFNCLTPNSPPISGRMASAIRATYGEVEKMQAHFNESALNNFGSGWVWLVFDKMTGMVTVTVTKDAGNPIEQGQIPLLCLDLWEHSYILDWDTNKANYIQNFWLKVNWKVVEENYNRISFI